MQERISTIANSLSTFCSEECHALCCRRGRITLDPAEAARFGRKELRKDGLATIELSKGCEHLSDERCTIYKERPQVCRDFPLFLRHHTLFVATICPAIKQGALDASLDELCKEFPALRIIRQ